NRNTWVRKSSSASTFTNARILTNLEAIGVKDVYRNTDSTSNIITVFLVFDTEDNYYKSVSRSVSMSDTNLNINPHTQFSPYGMAHRHSYIPSTSTKDHTETKNKKNHSTGTNNTTLDLTLSTSSSEYATGANAIPLTSIHQNRPLRS